MILKIQYLLNSNPYLKKYLRENSHYYKELIRNPNFIKELNDLMKKEYKLTIPQKLDKIKQDISMINSVMDILN